MPISRAAAEIEPVRPMRSTSSALPGPIAAADLPSTRNVKAAIARQSQSCRFGKNSCSPPIL